jgi:tRNA(adenine34) deaminase
MDQVMTPHTSWMKRAIALAESTARLGNIPVGAVIIHDGKLLAEAANLRHTLQDPTAHAELLALRHASQTLGSWRLEDTTLYVTLEPCSMCVGAIAQARVGRLVYGTDDPQGGAFSGGKATESTGGLEVVRDVLRQECEEVLKTFFSGLRSKT